MKNLSELNSKWYWRLIKVIWVIIYIIIFWVSSVWLFFYFSWYNPEKLENAKNIIIKNSKITQQLEKIEKELPQKNLTLIDLKKIIKNEYLNNVNSIAINFVMLQNLWKTLDQIWVCKEYYNYPLSCAETNPETILSAINEDKWRWLYLSYKTYQDAKSAFNDYQNAETKSINWINELISWKSTWLWNNTFNDFEKIYNVSINIWWEYDYRSILDYIKIIFSVIWVFLLILLFNFIFLRIIYYVVLWQFFPKEN